jgi:hypothetical protein
VGGPQCQEFALTFGFMCGLRAWGHKIPTLGQQSASPANKGKPTGGALHPEQLDEPSAQAVLSAPTQFL